MTKHANVTARLIKAKKNIKQKLAALKENKLISEELLRSQYKPITESIRSMTAAAAAAAPPPKEERRDITEKEEQKPAIKSIKQQSSPFKKKKYRGRKLLGKMMTMMMKYLKDTRNQ